MRIEKNTYDKNYPFTICDGWGGRTCCDLEDLEDLAFEIEKILKEERAKIQVTVSVAQLKEN